MQKIVVWFSSTAASVIVTPNSMVRMIVSATTDGGQAVASGTGHLGGVVVECRNPNRHPPRPHLSSTTRPHSAISADHRCTLIHEEPVFHLSNSGLGFTVAIALIGTIVGALCAGKLTDMFGRTKMLLAIGILYVLGVLGTALTSDHTIFVICRFLGGIALFLT